MICFQICSQIRKSILISMRSARYYRCTQVCSFAIVFLLDIDCFMTMKIYEKNSVHESDCFRKHKGLFSLARCTHVACSFYT